MLLNAFTKFLIVAITTSIPFGRLSLAGDRLLKQDTAEKTALFTRSEFRQTAAIFNQFSKRNSHNSFKLVQLEAVKLHVLCRKSSDLMGTE